ncbi:MAG: 2TM domain-containing protein [Saprospiraceae bacterium]|nr:2TM domain-containing protein [Saprospiraceae bacterium]
MSGKTKYERAKERVQKQKKFYRHVVSWISTSIFIMVLFLFLRMPPWITLVVIAGWGVGIAAEAVEVFGLPGMDRNWEERKIKEEMERMEQWEDDDHLDLEDPPEMEERSAQPRQKWRDSDLV